jgi:hypothetical protein
MGRMAFSSENRTNSKQEYPKLKLEKNEVARIVIIEKEPWREFVHTLTMPKIEDGTVVMQTRQRRDGSEFQEHATDFVGRPLCLGDEETMLLHGSDPDNCPLCAEAIASPGVIPVAVPRFAAQVLKYATKPGSSTLRTPFSVELAVWSFTERMSNNLIDLAEQWGNLQDHDLQLGPCKNAAFQLFDVGVLPQSEWQADDDRRKIAIETLKENKVDDEVLASACGRKTQRSYILADIEKIKQRWAQVHSLKSGGPATDMVAEATSAPVESLDKGIDDLLSTDGASAKTEDVSISKPNTGADSLSMDDLLSEV